MQGHPKIVPKSIPKEFRVMFALFSMISWISMDFLGMVLCAMICLGICWSVGSLKGKGLAMLWDWEPFGCILEYVCMSLEFSDVEKCPDFL